LILAAFRSKLRSSIVVIVLAFAALGLLLGLAQSFESQAGQLLVLSKAVSQEIDSSIAVLGASSQQPEVRRADSVSLISTAQMGIPMDADGEKRAVAQEILAQNQDFASIFFLTPEGNLYMGEPFDQQKQLPRLNYSDRDWYLGAVRTNDAYVSSVFMSAAINRPAIAIAIPVYVEEGSDQLSGYWVAIIKLEEIENTLRQSVLGNQSRIVLVDHTGLVVADISGDSSSAPMELYSYSGLASVQQALEGKSGELRETVDGESMDVRFAPVMVYPHTWALISTG
jgi:hypothetical protein